MVADIKPGPLVFKPLPNPSQYGLGWGHALGTGGYGSRETTRLVRKCPDCFSKYEVVSYQVKVTDRDGKTKRITQSTLSCKCKPFPPAASMEAGTYLP